ncbi:MAG: hypothetical protein AABX12_01130 [Nanoarchaeota archaeon]
MVKEDKQVRMAIIAGASHALKYKSKNFRATDDEILRHISENVDNILGNMDNPL